MRVRNRRAAAERTIENKISDRVLRSEEAESNLQKSCREICGARGRTVRRLAREHGRVGTAYPGRGEWRDSLSTKRGQVFRARFEHEAVHFCSGAREIGTGLSLSYHAGDAGLHPRRGRIER